MSHKPLVLHICCRRLWIRGYIFFFLGIYNLTDYRVVYLDRIRGQATKFITPPLDLSLLSVPGPSMIRNSQSIHHPTPRCRVGTRSGRISSARRDCERGCLVVQAYLTSSGLPRDHRRLAILPLGRQSDSSCERYLSRRNCRFFPPPRDNSSGRNEDSQLRPLRSSRVVLRHIFRPQFRRCMGL